MAAQMQIDLSVTSIFLSGKLRVLPVTSNLPSTHFPFTFVISIPPGKAVPGGHIIIEKNVNSIVIAEFVFVS